MSRKSLMAVLAVIGAVLVFISEQFGLGLNIAPVLAGVTATLLYVLFEAKADLRRVVGRIGTQSGKFTDPKFLAALISTVLVAVAEAFGWDIPVEAIVSVLTVLMAFLFGKEAFNSA